jgi:hypothetical protein
MKVNNENEEGPAQLAAAACRVFESQFAYGETAGLELLKRITFLAATSANISTLFELRWRPSRGPRSDRRFLGRYPVGIIGQGPRRRCDWSK